jgi:hypothetical protein
MMYVYMGCAQRGIHTSLMRKLFFKLMYQLYAQYNYRFKRMDTHVYLKLTYCT